MKEEAQFAINKLITRPSQEEIILKALRVVRCISMNFTTELISEFRPIID